MFYVIIFQPSIFSLEKGKITPRDRRNSRNPLNEKSVGEDLKSFEDEWKFSLLTDDESKIDNDFRITVSSSRMAVFEEAEFHEFYENSSRIRGIVVLARLQERVHVNYESEDGGQARCLRGEQLRFNGSDEAFVCQPRSCVILVFVTSSGNGETPQVAAFASSLFLFPRNRVLSIFFFFLFSFKNSS